MAYNANLLSAVSGTVKEIMGAQSTHQANIAELVRKFYRASIMQAFEHRSFIIARDALRMMKDKKNLPLFAAACAPFAKGLTKFTNDNVFEDNHLVSASLQNEIAGKINALDMYALPADQKAFVNPLRKMFLGVNTSDMGQMAMACFKLARARALEVVDKVETDDDMEFTLGIIRTLEALEKSEINLE